MRTPRSKKRAPPLVLQLYVAGDSPNSVAAKINLSRAVAHLKSDELTLEVVDVLSNPERGLSGGVLVTPTLVKVAPPPERRIIGNLRDHAGLLAVLGIEPAADE